MPLYFHYAFDDFRIKMKGEEAILYGYKKINNRRESGSPNKRHSNIIKSSDDNFVEGIIYNINSEESERFINIDEVEKIDVNVTKNDGTIVNAFTFIAKSKWTFGDERHKTDADVNLSGQLLGSDKGVQATRARLTSKFESKKYLKNYIDFKFINN